jgi:hypothetical protein
MEGCAAEAAFLVRVERRPPTARRTDGGWRYHEPTFFAFIADA